MRRKPYPVIGLTGGLDTSVDPAFLSDIASPNVDNVRFHKGLVKKEFGFIAHGDANERVMLFDTYTQYDGTVYPMCVTVDKAYRWVSNAWSAVSGAGAVFTGDEDDRFESATMNDLWIVTNAKDVVKEWNGSVWANLGGLATVNVTTVQTMAAFYSHFVIANITEGGNLLTSRVRWSDTGDPEDWNTGTAGAMDIVDTPGGILTLKIIRDRLFAFKTDSVWEIVYVGGTTVFEPRLILDVGIRCGGSVVTFGNTSAAMFTDGFFTFDGLYREDIGKQVYPLLFETESTKVHWEVIGRAQAAYVEETGEYVICLPEGQDEPQTIYKMSTRGKSWSKYSPSGAITCFGQRSEDVGMTWTEAKALGTKWDNAYWDFSWKNFSVPVGTYSLLGGATDGRTVEDNRSTISPLELVFETKDFIMGHSVRWKYVVAVVRGIILQMQFSTDQGLSWSVPKVFSPDPDKFSECIMELGVTGMHMRFRLTSSSGPFALRWVEPTYIERKRSRKFIRGA